MRILIVTDAWEPQVNGVVRTIKSTCRELQKMGHVVETLTPLEFKTIPCPTYPDIRLSLFPKSKVIKRIESFQPDAIHIATEGPLGIAARAWALRHNHPFSTAYHTRFPEYVHARLRIPLSWTYQYLKWFHGPAKAIMAPTLVVKHDLESAGFKHVVLWSRGVELDIFSPRKVQRLGTRPPIFLYVGRVAVEKISKHFWSWIFPVQNGLPVKGLPCQPCVPNTPRQTLWAC